MAKIPSPEVPTDIPGFSFSPIKLASPKTAKVAIPFPPSLTFATVALPDFPKPSKEQMASNASTSSSASDGYSNSGPAASAGSSGSVGKVAGREYDSFGILVPLPTDSTGVARYNEVANPTARASARLRDDPEIRAAHDDVDAKYRAWEQASIAHQGNLQHPDVAQAEREYAGAKDYVAQLNANKRAAYYEEELQKIKADPEGISSNLSEANANAIMKAKEEASRGAPAITAAAPLQANSGAPQVAVAPAAPSTDYSVVNYARAKAMSINEQAQAASSRGDQDTSYVLNQVAQSYANVSSPGMSFDMVDAQANNVKARAEDEMGSMIAARDLVYVPLGMKGTYKKADGVRVRSDDGVSWYQVYGERDQALPGGQTGRSISYRPFVVNINNTVNRSDFF